MTRADLMSGEEYDARLETAGWTRAGFDDSGWVAADAVGRCEGRAGRGRSTAPARVESEIAAKKVTEPKPGVFVFDLGQNMVGAVRLRVAGKAGTTVRLRHAEVLNPDGTDLHRQSAHRPAPRTRTPQGRRHGDLRAALHLPRLPLRRGDGLSRASRRWTRSAGRVIHTSAPFTMDFKTERPDAQPAAQQHHLGPARQLPVHPHGHSRARRAARLDRRHQRVRADRRLHDGVGAVPHQVAGRPARRPGRRTARSPMWHRSSAPVGKAWRAGATPG